MVFQFSSYPICRCILQERSHNTLGSSDGLGYVSDRHLDSAVRQHLALLELLSTLELLASLCRPQFKYSNDEQRVVIVFVFECIFNQWFALVAP